MPFRLSQRGAEFGISSPAQHSVALEKQKSEMCCVIVARKRARVNVCRSSCETSTVGRKHCNFNPWLKPVLTHKLDEWQLIDYHEIYFGSHKEIINTHRPPNTGLVLIPQHKAQHLDDTPTHLAVYIWLRPCIMKSWESSTRVFDFPLAGSTPSTLVWVLCLIIKKSTWLKVLG